MAYEYESTIDSFINESLDDSDIKTEIEKENKEVYRKAKAFDKISNLIESNYVDYDKNNLEDVEAIVNEYWEDK